MTKSIKKITVKTMADIPTEGFNRKIIFSMVKCQGEYKVTLNGEKIHFVKGF